MNGRSRSVMVGAVPPARRAAVAGGASLLLLGALVVSGCSHVPAYRPAPPPRADTTRVHESEADQKKDAAQVHTELAAAYMREGDLKGAIEKAQMALTFQPNYAPAHTILGAAYEKAGMLTDAEKQYRAALALNPKDGDANNNIGHFLCTHGGNTAEAQGYFKAALADPFYDTPSLAWSNAGTCALHDNRAPSLSDPNTLEAEQDFRQALAIDPHNPFALLGMARILYGTNRVGGASVYMHRWLDVNMVTASGLRLGYDIAVSDRDTATAQMFRDRLVSTFPDAPEAASFEQAQDSIIAH